METSKSGWSHFEIPLEMQCEVFDAPEGNEMASVTTTQFLEITGELTGRGAAAVAGSRARAGADRWV